MWSYRKEEDRAQKQRADGDHECMQLTMQLGLYFLDLLVHSGHFCHFNLADGFLMIVLITISMLSSRPPCIILYKSLLISQFHFLQGYTPTISTMQLLKDR